MFSFLSRVVIYINDIWEFTKILQYPLNVLNLFRFTVDKLSKF